MQYVHPSLTAGIWHPAEHKSSGLPGDIPDDTLARQGRLNAHY